MKKQITIQIEAEAIFIDDWKKLLSLIETRETKEMFYHVEILEK